ncbi:hypothetical protein ACP26L_25765 [Paenibacillus sp. S-38]|uniref:hypothetical protein n=1 Tax=Paenibacillus sp. S-38 TaxID=3416710 RepID=UPI003CEE2608
MNEKTIRRWIKDLETHEYIKVTRAPNGLILTVKNSKKFADKNVRSQVDDRTKMSDQSSSDRTEMSDPPDKNVRCNKDITEILIDRLIDDLDDEFLRSRCGVPSSVAASLSASQIHLDPETIAQRAKTLEDYFNQRRRRLIGSNADWESALEVARKPIPLEFALFGIDLAFAKHNKYKKRVRESIRTFAYCKTVILESWDFVQDSLNQSYDPSEVEELRPSAPKPERKSKQQRQLEALKRFGEEEKKRGQA